VKQQNFPDLTVNLTQMALGQLSELKFSQFKTGEEFLACLMEVLRSDPRSVYRKGKASDRLFFTNIDNIHVTAWFDSSSLGEGKVRAEILRLMPAEDVDLS